MNLRFLSFLVLAAMVLSQISCGMARNTIHRNRAFRAAKNQLKRSVSVIKRERALSDFLVPIQQS